MALFRRLIFFLIICGLLIALILGLSWFAMHKANPAPAVNITGYVSSSTDPDVGSAKVTLWQDGKIVPIPDNPRFTQATPHEYWPNGTSWFEFNSVPKADYDILVEKDGYVGWGWYDPDNPLPVMTSLTYGPNATGLCINQYLGRPVQIYSNVSKPDIDKAISITLSNASVQQIVTGTNSEIVTIYKHTDASGENTCYTLRFVEQFLPGHTPPALKFMYLDVEVNIEDEKVTGIKKYNNTTNDMS